MTPEEQVDLWVAGKPVHNPDRDECCPDFSCCTPELLSDLETRKAFKAADKDGREKMLWGFLSALIGLKCAGEVDVYLAGDPGHQEEP